MSKELGRFISLQQANDEVNKFLDIRDKTFHKINERLQADLQVPDDSRLYFSEQEISFVFEKEKLLQLISKAGSRCNGVRVYYAASPKDETVDGEEIKKGSTTLVIIPCVISKAKNGDVTKVENIITDDDPGLEYPGGGTFKGNTIDVSKDILVPPNIRAFF